MKLTALATGLNPGPSEPAIGRRRREEEGFAEILWVLGLALMVLVLGGLSTDLWHPMTRARALDAAADSAAAAGANGIDLNIYRQTNGKTVLDPNLATQLALDNLAHQSGLPGPLNPQITVTLDSITVVLHGHVDLTLLRVFDPRGIDLTSTGTAAARAGP